MSDFRIRSHPILHDTSEADIPFFWSGRPFFAKSGEMIASALIANGISTFGHHPKDHSPQGIFCANGQCAQCLVIADRVPVKACMTAIQPHMQIEPAEGLPILPEVLFQAGLRSQPTPVVETGVLIIGGGPAGLSAAIELGKLGIHTLLIDDKPALGGKLVLQTHRFFGSKEAVFAGTRGIEIAQKLSDQLQNDISVDLWLGSTALAIFEDRSVAVLRDGKTYTLVKPELLLVCSGAREKSLPFPGNTLPGIYGAGAFQTLVNRDLVRPCQNLFIIGGGNVGLIAGYHAIQAGIHVAGLAEAAPRCGGYKVHLDKLVRSGVPVLTSHTVTAALGRGQLERVIIAEVDDHFQAIAGTEQTFDCDTLLIAVGLDPVNEFIHKAKQVGLPVLAAGDAQEIAEASAAIFSGRIAGLRAAGMLGLPSGQIPAEWLRMEEILKSRPGQTFPEEPPLATSGVFPVIHCNQEIPCNPCSQVCPHGLIRIDADDIRHLPVFSSANGHECSACGRCLAVCPGLAITLVDFRKTASGSALVTLPVEVEDERFLPGQLIELCDTTGNSLATRPVKSVRKVAGFKNGTSLVTVEAPSEIAAKIAGIRLLEATLPPFSAAQDLADHPTYICRCERVTVNEIRQLIRSGIRDINQIKAVTKASMGACGGKTCLNMIRRLFQEEGVPLSEVTETTIRPLFVEVPVAVLGNIEKIELQPGENS